MKILILLSVGLLAGCGIMPSEGRIFDPDKEFAKLEGPDIPTVQKSLERSAIQALANGNYQRAAGLYDQLTDHDPKQMRYQFGMAESLRRLGENKAAIMLYDNVLRADPKHIDAMEGKALAKMAAGDTEESARILQDVLNYDRSRWRTLNGLGILFAIKSMNNESVAYLNEALRVSANNPSVLNNLGLIQAASKNYSDAVRTLKQAAQHSSGGTQREQVDLNLALVYGISGDLHQAEQLASEHLDSGALQNNLGLYAYLSDNKELAKSYLNMALTGTDVHYKRAWENLDIIAEEDQVRKKPKGPSKRIKIN